MATKFLIEIGGAIAGSFGKAFGTADREVGRLGAAVKSLDQNAQSIQGLRRLREQTANSKTDFEQARLQLHLLEQQLRGVSEPTKQQIRDQKSAQAAVERTGNAYLANRTELARMEKQLESSGIDVRRLNEEEKRLGSTLELNKRKLEGLVNVQQRIQSLRDERRNAIGELVGTGASLFGASRLVGQAADFDYQLRMFGNIAEVSADRIVGIKEQVNAISRDAVQAPGEVLTSLQTLVGAGLDVERSLAALPTIARTATATGAAVEDLSKTTFTLIDTMSMAPTEMPRAMDMLAKAGKLGNFELRDMAQHLPAIGAQAKALGLQGADGVATLAAALQIARRGAADAGTAANNLSEFMGKLTQPDTIRRFEEAGISLENEFKAALAAGKDPIIEMIALIDQLTQGGDQFRIGELFGDKQAKQFLQIMLKNRADFDSIRSEVLAAKGVVDKDFANVSESAKAQIDQFKNSMGRLGDAVANTVLPVVNAVIGPLATGAEWLAKLATEFPKVTATIVGTIGALVTIKGAFAAFTILRTTAMGGALEVEKLAIKLGILRGQLAATSAVAGGAAGKGGGFMAGGMGKNAKVAGAIGAGLAVAGAAYSVYDTATTEGLTKTEKGESIGETVGGTAGSVAGTIAGSALGVAAAAKLGALMGTTIAPGIGTAVGAVVGGFGAYLAGSAIGKTIGGWIGSLFEDEDQQKDEQGQKVEKPGAAIQQIAQVNAGDPTQWTDDGRKRSAAEITAADARASTARGQVVYSPTNQITIDASGQDPAALELRLDSYLRRRDREQQAEARGLLLDMP